MVVMVNLCNNLTGLRDSLLLLGVSVRVSLEEISI